MEVSVLDKPHRPLPVRVINGLGKSLHLVGLKFPSLKEDALLKAAMKTTGLHDFGEEHFREGLRRYLESLEKDAQLNTIGRISAATNIKNMLVNRLQVVDHLKKNPEILERKIEKPIFIIGLPRTGTTILHALLDQDPANRTPLCWESSRPYPVPRPETYETDPRIAQLDKEFEQFFKLAPGFQTLHKMSATLPQECIVLMTMDMMSIQFFSQFNVVSYQQWLDHCDMMPVYRAHKTYLQYLESGGVQGERWLLKSPGHLHRLQEVLAVYPDACIIQTHRDPMQVVTSAASLFTLVRRIGSDHVDPKAVGRQQLEWWASLLQRSKEQRQQLEAAGTSFYDLKFQDFISDPVANVEKIYQHFGLELKPEAQQAMQTFMRENPRDQHGRHRYQPEEFGIHPEQDKAIFREYMEYFELV